ncbi:tetratricopeptide repeat protein [Aeromicrobium sp.]|uniref:tetratricopeptide repeat protein n=1 Tax=Aeromicrobium sp. TaxID=1871063 RepID=UPI0025B86A4C|nr:tetratricopeptide repeat protein [Aeromicrobium sp.]MCK5890899.1 tetratricopeptide repeat protein [Aeromicrobium sp.]
MSTADDAVRLFEEAGEHDSAGREAEAAVLYEQAMALGLDAARSDQLVIQYASTLRNLDRADEAVELLQALPADSSVGTARAAFLALALRDAGRPDEALRIAIEALLPTLPRYHRSVAGYAAELTDEADEGPARRSARARR